MRKTLIKATRLFGDLDLGLEQTRVRGTVKDWARADFPGGLVPGGTVQEIGEATTAKNYRIGTRRVQDERVYHYCRASANGCEQPYWGAQNQFDYNTDETLGDCISGTTVGDKEADDLTLVVGDTNDLHIADFFEGGWAAVTVGPTIQMLRIRANTAGGGETDQVTLYLWDPLIIDVAEGSQIEVYPSIYGKVERVLAGGSPNRATVCVPNLIIPTSRYFWGQTYGPCYGIAPEPFPKGIYENMLVFNYQGSLYLQGARSANNMHQIAGYKLMNYETDEAGYLIFYMLTLAP